MKLPRSKLIIFFLLTVGIIFAVTPGLADAAQISPIAIGEEVAGVLGEGDAALNAGQYCDWYRFYGRAGQRVLITLSSDSFDAVLYLVKDSDWKTISFDDDHGGGGNAAIGAFRLPYTGNYLIWAAAYREGQVGDYTLTLHSIPSSYSSTPISPGQTLSGSLDEADISLRVRGGRGFKHFDTYTFSTDTRQAVCINVTADGFTPFVQIWEGQNLVTASIPPGDTSANMTQVVFIPYSGPSFTLWVGSAQYNARGEYTISMKPCLNPGPSATLSLGSTSGNLSPLDFKLNTGQYTDIYLFNGRANHKVSFTQTSDHFDSYLRVVSKDGIILRASDDTDKTQNSTITDFKFPYSGTYALWAGTVFPGGEGGSYVLTYSTNATTVGVIEGRVTDTCSGEGLEGVRVAASYYFTYTAPDGFYAIANVAPGNYVLKAQVDDYLSVNQSITVEIGETTTGDFALQSDRRPVLAAIPDITVDEGESVSFTAGAEDGDNDTLSYTITGWQCGEGISGPDFNYATTCEDAGVYTVTVTVKDEACGEDSQIVHITVEDNDPVWYQDLDGDGYGNGYTRQQCPRPPGHYLPDVLLSMTGDCDDDNGAVNPAAAEIYDGIDNNCDGNTDENCFAQAQTPLGGDVEISLLNCTVRFERITVAGETVLKIVSPAAPPAPASFALMGEYYDISTTAQYVGEIEICFNYDGTNLTDSQEREIHLLHYKNGHWQDTGSAVDIEADTICGEITGFSEFALARPRTPDYDVDEDGYGIEDDCDDNNPQKYPGGEEVCDGQDNDCDGVSDQDFTDSDKDGFGDDCDNCPDIPNPNQRDTDNDGQGNRCDADLDNNGTVNSLDVGLFRTSYYEYLYQQKYNGDCDFNGDGLINTLDYSIFRQLFLKHSNQ